MKKMGFALVGAAALALVACGRDDADTLNDSTQQNYETDQLNQLADNAAAEAEVEALGTQAQQIEREQTRPAENATNEAAADPTDPAEVEDDVQGM
jgi:hypothetical protein